VDIFSFYQPVPPNRLIESTTKKPLERRQTREVGLVQDYQVGTAFGKVLQVWQVLVESFSFEPVLDSASESS